MVIYLRSLPEFEYIAPKGVKEACSLLKKYEGRAKVMSGGTDLLVNMKYRTVVPQFVIGLRNVPGLDRITYNTLIKGGTGPPSTSLHPPY